MYAQQPAASIRIEHPAVEITLNQPFNVHYVNVYAADATRITFITCIILLLIGLLNMHTNSVLKCCIELINESEPVAYDLMHLLISINALQLKVDKK